MQLKRSEKLELILESLPKTIEACKAWEKNRNIGIQAAVIYTTDWQDCPCPSFDPEKYKYRICERVPLTQEQAKCLIDKIVLSPGMGCKYIVYDVTDKYVLLVSLPSEDSPKPYLSQQKYKDLITWTQPDGIQLWH